MNQGPYGPSPTPLAPSGFGNGPPPSGYGSGGPPYGGGGPPVDDTMGWVAIATGALGWLSCCCTPIPFIGLLFALGGLVFAVVATITGYLALQKAKQQNSRTDLAMIGLVLGAVRLGLTVLGIVAVVVLMALGLGAGILEGITHPR